MVVQHRTRGQESILKVIHARHKNGAIMYGRYQECYCIIQVITRLSKCADQLTAGYKGQ